MDDARQGVLARALFAHQDCRNLHPTGQAHLFGQAAHGRKLTGQGVEAPALDHPLVQGH
jgi:hypothetical protein